MYTNTFAVRGGPVMRNQCSERIRCDIAGSWKQQRVIILVKEISLVETKITKMELSFLKERTRHFVRINRRGSAVQKIEHFRP